MDSYIRCLKSLNFFMIMVSLLSFSWSFPSPIFISSSHTSFAIIPFLTLEKIVSSTTLNMISFAILSRLFLVLSFNVHSILGFLYIGEHSDQGWKRYWLSCLYRFFNDHFSHLVVQCRQVSMHVNFSIIKFFKRK